MVKKNNSFIRIIVDFFAVALVFLFGGFFVTNLTRNNLTDNAFNNKIPNVLGFSDNENSFKYIVYDNQIFGYEEWLSNIVEPTSIFLSDDDDKISILEKGNLEFVFLKNSTSLLSTSLSQENIASVVTALYDGDNVSVSITEQYDLSFVSNSVDAQYSLYSLALGTDAQLNYADGYFYVGETHRDVTLLGSTDDNNPLVCYVQKGSVDFSGDKTYTSNSATRRAFYVSGGNLKLSGITIKGFTSASGAGVLVENTGSTLTLDCNIESCSATNGGAVYCAGTLVINSGKFSSNSATNGGAFYCENVSLDGQETTFDKNSASYGKDFYLSTESALITLTTELPSKCSIYKTNLKSFDDVYDRCTALGYDSATINKQLKTTALIAGDASVVSASESNCGCENDVSINQGRMRCWQTLGEKPTTVYIVYEWDTSLLGINPKNPTSEYSDESLVAKYTNAQTFDGSTYEVIGREYMFTDKITINVWAYMDNWSDYTQGMRIYSCTESGGWNIEPSGENIQFACYDSGVGYKTVNTGVAWSSLSSGWHMFTMTFDGEFVRAYIDGQNKGSSAKYVSGKIGYHSGNSIIIGAEAGGTASPAGSYFKGKIQSFSIINDCFYASEINNIYSQNNRGVILISKNRSEQHTLATDMPYVGYSFKEWTSSSGGGVLEDNTFTFISGVSMVLATYTVNTYKVTLDPQGATKSGTTEYYYQYGKTQTINNVVCYYFSDKDCKNPLNKGYYIDCPEKTGYTFKGYFTEKEGKGKQYVSATGECINNIYRTVAEDTQLYAYWEINNYTITYNTNGGTISTAGTTSYTIEKDITLAIAKRDGYSFDTWKVTTAGGYWKSGATFSNGQSLSKGTYYGNVTLTVQWKVNSYTITYNTNGGTISTAGTTSYTIEKDITLAIAKRDGYSFDTWKVTTAGGYWMSGATFSNGQSLSKGTYYGNVTLTAQWKVNSYTITYNANGGTSTEASKTYTIENDITLATASRTGYTFDVWKVTIAGGYWKSGATFSNGQSLSKGTYYGNVTLTAQWKVNSYTITFDGNGSEVQYAITWNYAGGDYTVELTSITGSYSIYSFDATKAKYTLNYDSEFGINSPIPVRRGYTFDGWYTASTGGTQIIASGANEFNASVSGYTNASKQWIKAGDATLYAHWTAKTYEISYNLNSGTAGTNNPKNYTVASGATVSDPTRAGYTFTGWEVVASVAQMNSAYIDLKDGHQHYHSDYSSAVIYEPFYIRSGVAYEVPYGNGEIRWRSYNASTGAYAGSISSSGKYTPTADSNIAIWYHKGNSTDGATSTTITFAGGTGFNTSTAKVTGNLTLNAKWEINKYTVTYDAKTNGGTFASASGYSSTAEIAYNSAIDLSKTNRYGTKSGWTFVGWNTNKNATTALSSLKMGTSDITLYAIYSKTLTGTFYYGLSKASSETKSVTIYNTATSGTITSLENKANITYNSRTFSALGWRADTTATTASISANASVKISANTSYYQVYSGTLTLSYDANGGSSKPTAQTATQYYSSSGNVSSHSFTLASAINKTGHTFSKWAQGSTSGTQYLAGVTVTLSVNTTFYAIWSTNTYTVTFNSNGGDSMSVGTVPANTRVETNIKMDYSKSLVVTGSFALTNSGRHLVLGAYNGNSLQVEIKDNKFRLYCENATTTDTLGTVTLSVGAIYAYRLEYNPTTKAITLTGYNGNGGIVEKLSTTAKSNSVTASNYFAVGSKDYRGDSSPFSAIVLGTTTIYVGSNSAYKIIPVSGGMSVNGTTKTVTGYSNYQETYTKTITYNTTYGDLPTPTRTGWTFEGWTYKNLLDLSNPVINSYTTLTNSHTLSITVNTTGNSITQFKVQKYKDGKLVTDKDGNMAAGVQFSTTSEKGKWHSASFTKDSTFNQLRFAVNGTKMDSSYVVDVSHLINGVTYTLSYYLSAFDAEKCTATITNMMIERGSTRTSFVAFDGTKITADSVMNSDFDHELIAQWSKKLTVNFYQVDGSNDAQTVTIKNKATSATIKAPAVDAKSGYTIVGWGTSTSATAKSLSSGQTNLTVSIDGSNSTIKDGAKYYAIYTYPVTVTFNGNGNTGGSTANATGTAYYTANGTSGATSKQASITLTANGFSRSGYSFTGWNTDKNAKTVLHTDKKTISLASGITLYAIWTENGYKVTFDPNGGSVSPTNKTVTYNSAYGDLPTPTRDGYKFLGWDNNLATSLKYAGWLSGTEYPTNASTGTYTLSFSGSKDWVAWYVDMSAYVGKNVTISGTIKSISTTGGSTLRYIKVGQTATSGNAYFISGGENEEVVSSNTTIPTGGLNFSKTCNIIKGTNDVSIIGIIIWQDNKGDNTSISAVVENLKIEVGDGATDFGYITKDTIVKASTDHTLTAKWKANEYTVNFDANGGTCTPSSKKVTFDSTYGDLPTTPTTLTIYTKTGYTVAFKGWFTAKTGGTQVTKDTTVTTASNHTLYAQYTETPITYKITYYSTSTSSASATQNVKYDATYSLPTAPTKTGFTFVGWSEGNDNSAEWTSGTKICAGAKSWYAVWKKTWKFYDTSASTTTKDVYYAVASNASQTYSKANPALSGYTFAGYATSNSTTIATKAGTSTTSLSSSSATPTYYAVWNTSVDISYEGNGATGGATSSHKATVSYTYNLGSSKSYATLETNGFTKIGYDFSAWAQGSASGTQYSAGKTVENITKDTKFYAIWKASKYTVTLNQNGGTGGTSSVTATYDSAMPTISNLPTRTGYYFAGYTSAQNPNFTAPTYSVGKLGSTSFRINVGTSSTFVQGVMVKFAISYAYTSTSTTSKISSIDINDVKTYSKSIYIDNDKQVAYGFVTITSSNYIGKYSFIDINFSEANTLTTVKVDYLQICSTTGLQYYTLSGTSQKNYDVANKSVLYAQWVPKAYTVKFDANGGTCSTTDKRVAYGETYGTLPTPTLTGYNLEGWSNSLFSTDEYFAKFSTKTSGESSGSTWSYDASAKAVTLKAKDSNTDFYLGTYNNSAHYYISVEKATTYVFSWYQDVKTSAIRTYIFLYDEDKPCTTAKTYNGSAENETLVDGDTITVGGTTYYRYYVKITTKDTTKTMQFRFGVSGSDSKITLRNMLLEKMDEESTTDVKAYLGTPNYKVTSSSIVQMKNDHTLTARWQANKYTVKFDGNGATSGSMENLSCTYDTVSQLPANGFSRTGYDFAGWKVGAGGGLAGSASSLGTTIVANSTVLKNQYYIKNLTSANNATVTLTAQWTAHKYNISYTLNGGTIDSKAPTNPNYGDNVTIPNPTYTGRTFLGWTITGVDESTAKYNTSSVLKNGASGITATSFLNLNPTNNSTVTFVASWQINTYKIAYTLNGGTSGSKAPTSATYDANPIEISNPTRTGYTFTGWTASNLNTSTALYGTASNNVITKWTNGTTKVTATYFKNLTATQGATVTLTANWAEKSYKIEYVLNGGTSGSKAPTSAKFNTAIEISNPTRTGYIFDGWTASNLNTSTAKYGTASGSVTTSWNGTTKVKATLADAESLWFINLRSDPDKTVILTANWTAITYTVKFNGNGTTYGSMSDQPFKYDVGQNLYANGFVKVGYGMKWNTKADGTGTSYTDKQWVINLAATNNAVVNLYAIWTKNSYTITFNGNGGTCTDKSTTVEYGTNISSLPTPTRTGYTFDGWYAQFNGTSDFINMGREYMYTDKISVHLLAYADDWSSVAGQRLISCTDNGGWNIEGSGGYIQYSAYDSGKGYKPALSTTKWASLASGWHTFDLIFDGSYIYGYLDGTKIATSEKFESGKIGYHSQNSIMIGAEATSSGTTVDSNYFKGYIGNFVINHNTTRITNANNMLTMPAQNITLYARWTANTYKVTLSNEISTLNNSGASNVEGTKEFYYKFAQTQKSSDGKITYYYYTDKSCDIKYGLTNGYYIAKPVSPGYTFKGYFTEKLGKGTQYVNENGMCINNIYRTVAGDTTLYAYWVANSYTVSFNANGGEIANGMTFEAGARLETDIVWDYRKSITIMGSFMIPSSIGSRRMIIGSYPGNAVQVEILSKKLRLYCENTSSAALRDVQGAKELSAGVWYAYNLDYDAVLGTISLKLYASNGTLVDSLSTVVNNKTLVATRALVVGAKDYRVDVNSSDPNPFASISLGAISVVQDYADEHLYTPISATTWKDTKTNKTFTTSGTLITLSSRKVEYNTAYGALPTPIKYKTGYNVEFLGWWTAASGGTQILDSSTMKNAGDQILYAHWKETAREYAVQYNNMNDLVLTYTKHNQTSEWTHSGAEHIYPSQSSTDTSGPYVSGLSKYMTNGAKYRIYFTAKIDTGTLSLSANFEAGGTNRSKTCNFTTTYQRFYIETTYDSSAKHEALTFYSTAWTGQKFYIKDIEIVQIVTYDGTYNGLLSYTKDNVLHTPSKEGYTFEGWSNEIFNFQELLRSLTDVNSTNGTTKRDLTENTLTLTQKNTESSTTSTEMYTNPWNGSTYYVNVLPNTTYTFSWKQDNDTSVKNLVFLCNDANTTYTSALGGAGTKDASLGRYYITFKTSSTTTVLRFRFGLQGQMGKTVILSEVKLEKGSKPTAYFVTNSSKIASNFNHELEAVYKSNSFTIAFAPNKPSTASSSVAGSTASVTGVVYNVGTTLTKNAFTLKGWTFKGWATTLGGAVAYNDGQALTDDQVNSLYKLRDTSSNTTTLYAVWGGNTYYVTFEKNAPTSTNAVAGTMANEEFTYDVAKALTANAYSLTGYSFNGWNTKSDGTGTTYTDEQIVKNLATSGTISLYAMWVANSYTVTFNGNATAGDLLLANLWNYAGTSGYTSDNNGNNGNYTTSGVTANISVTFDKTYSCYAPIPVRRGYTFAGWYTASSGGTKIVDSGANTFIASVSGYTNENKQWIKAGDATLYAHWTAKTYTISYDLNYGTKGSSNPTSYTVASGATVSDPTRTGYTFAGWTVTATLNKMNYATIDLNNGVQKYTGEYDGAVYYELFRVKAGVKYTGVSATAQSGQSAQIRWRAYNYSTGAYAGSASGSTSYTPNKDTIGADWQNIAFWYHLGNNSATTTIEMEGIKSFSTSGYCTTGNLSLKANWTNNKYTLYVISGQENLLSANEMAIPATYSGNNCTGTFDPKNGGTWTITPKNTTDPFIYLNQTLSLTAGSTYYIHMTIRNTDGTIPTSGSMQLFIGLNGAYKEAHSVKFTQGGGIAIFKAPSTGTYKLRMDNDYAGSAKVVTNFWVGNAKDTNYKTVTLTYKDANDKNSVINSYNLGTPSRTGHSFAKWNIVSGGFNIYDATDTSDSTKHLNNIMTINANSPYIATLSGTTLTIGAQNAVVFASYNRNACTVTLKSNDTTLGTVALTSISTYYGAKVSISGNKITIGEQTATATPKSIDGYTIAFKEWSGAPTTITSNCTITAVFTKTANGITIVLDNQSATTAGTTSVFYYFGSDSYKVSQDGNSIQSITKPTKTGYTFGGYFTEKNGAGKQYIDANGQFVNNLSKSISKGSTLYAKWTANIYEVEFDNYDITVSLGKNVCTAETSKSDIGAGVYEFDNITLSTAGKSGGPYISGWASPMIDGGKYRLYFTAKASVAISGMSAKFEGADTTQRVYKVGSSTGSTTIDLTTEYQEYYIEFTYKASLTYKAITFYSTLWAGQSFFIKDIKLTKLVTYDQAYGTLLDPTRYGYTFETWANTIFNFQDYLRNWFDQNNGTASTLSGSATNGKYELDLTQNTLKLTPSSSTADCYLGTYNNAKHYTMAVKPNTNYVFSWYQDVKTNAISNYIFLYDEDKPCTTATTFNGANSSEKLVANDTITIDGTTYYRYYVTITTKDTTKSMQVRFGVREYDGGSITIRNAQIELGTTPTSYGVDADTTVKTASNHTLSAQWKINNHTVTFNANGGSVSPSSKTVMYGAKYGTLPTPTRTGWTFEGWTYKNLLDLSNPVINNYTTLTNSHTLSITVNTTVNNVNNTISLFKVQKYKDGKYVDSSVDDRQFSTTSEKGKWHSASFTKDSTFNQLRFAVNGSNTDSSYVVDVSHLINGVTYTLSYYLSAFDATACTATITNMMIERGESATSFVAFGGTKITADSVMNSDFDHELIAQWSKKLTVNFYQVDGSNDAQTVTIKNKATSATIKAPAVDAKSGYTIVGWGTSTSATAKSFSSGQTNLTVSIDGSNSTIKDGAKYYAIYTYPVTVTFNGNGNTGGSTANATGTAYYTANGTSGATSKQASITLTANGFSRTGYTFSKWAQGSTSGTQYSAGATVSLSANTTFYAIWTANTYTVTFNSNGGDSMAVGKIPANTQVETNIKMDYSKSLVVTGSFALVNTGVRHLIFGNYTPGGNSLQVEITAGNLLRLYSENASTVDSYGGTALTKGVMYSYRLEYDARTKVVTLTAYNGDGSTFATLTTTKTSTTTSSKYFAVGSKDYRSDSSPFDSIVLGTTTIYVGSGSAYKIIPVSGGMSVNGTTKAVTGYSSYTETSTKGVVYSSAYGALPTPTKSKPGYTITFAGWWTAASGGTQVTSTTKLTNASNHTLHAHWTETANIYKVTLDNQGATTAGTTEYYYKFNTRGSNGEYFYTDIGLTTKLGSTSYTITKPTKTGYTFGGYYAEKNGGGTQYIDANGNCKNNLWQNAWDHTTLYAKWTVNTHTITFDGNGSEVQYAITWNYTGGGNYGSTSKTGSELGYTFDATKAKLENFVYGKALERYSPVPVRRGYTFDGWYTDASGGTKIIASGANAFNASVSGYTNANKQWIKDSNATLYAHWTAKTYDISYNLNGGTAGTNSPKSYTVASGATVSDPTRTGYTFTGWTVVASVAQMNLAYIDLNDGHQHYHSTYSSAVIYEPFYIRSGVAYEVPYGNGEIRWRSYNASTGAYAGSISSSGKYTPTADSNIAIWYHKGNSTDGATSTTITFAGGTGFNTSTAKVTGNLTLNAKWTPNIYNVEFIKNATYATGSMATQTLSYGVPEKLNANKFKYTDYDFIGWNTKADGTGTSYFDGQEVDDLTTTYNATVKLYAQWRIRKYIISFECLGEYSFNNIYVELGGKKYYGINHDITCTAGTVITWHYDSIAAVTKTSRSDALGVTTTVTHTNGVRVSIGDVDGDPDYNTSSSLTANKSGTITISEAHDGKVIKICHVEKVYSVTGEKPNQTTKTTYTYGEVPTQEGTTDETKVWKWTLNWDWVDNIEEGTQTVYVKEGDINLYANESCTTKATVKTSFGKYTFKGYYTGKYGNGDQYITSSGQKTNANNTGSVTLYAYFILNKVSVKVYRYCYDGLYNGLIDSIANSSKTGYYVYYEGLSFNDYGEVSDFKIYILENKFTPTSQTDADYYYDASDYQSDRRLAQQITITDSSGTNTYNSSSIYVPPSGWLTGDVTITIKDITSSTSSTSLSLEQSDNLSQNAIITLDDSGVVTSTTQVWLDDKFRKLQEKQDTAVDFDGVKLDA